MKCRAEENEQDQMTCIPPLPTMISMLPTLSSDEDNDPSQYEDDDEEDNEFEVDHSFQFGGILVSDQWIVHHLLFCELVSTFNEKIKWFQGRRWGSTINECA